MTALRQKMIEDMQLRGFALRTQEAYLLAVRQLARYYNKSPDRVTEEELRGYFLYLKNVKHAARNTCTIAPVRDQVLLPTHPRLGVENLRLPASTP